MSFLGNLSARLLLVFCLVPLLIGQETTGAITGLITDPSGAVLAGAEVTVVNVGTNASYKTQSNATGNYIFRTLPVGAYRLTAGAPGFKRFEATNLLTQVNEITRLDITMTVGTLSESIEVSAQVVNVNTEDASLRTVVDQRRVEDLPLNGRDPVQLMRLVAGVSLYNGSGLTSGTTYPGVVSVSVNGNRGNSTNYILDGGQNNDHYSNAPNPMPNPDALQEFSVQTNNFSAEFGRNSGGIVNAVTKSGTNGLHGVAFWYLRNNSLNAANFFAPPKPGSPNQKLDDGLKRNQAGITLGGPVLIPKLYNGKDKTFFFFSYQGTRLRQRPTSTFVNVLTPGEREGDFSAFATALKDPLGGQFPGNLIPKSRFFPGSKYLIDNNIPPPLSGRSITTTNLANYDDNQYLAKVDHQIGSNLRLSGHAFWSRAHSPGNLTANNYYEETDIRDWSNTSYVGNAYWILSPNILNQTTIGYNKTDGPASHVYPTKNWNDLGVPITLDQYSQFYIQFQSISSINTGDTNNFIRDEVQFNNTTRWTKGNHNLTFGGEYHHARGDIVNNFRAQGRFYFTRTAGYTGYDVADFLIGRWAEFIQGAGEFKNTRFHIINFFFNDSYKVSRRLTLNLGVRWEPFLPNTDVYGKVVVWGGPNTRSTRYTNAPPGVLYAGDPGIPAGGFKNTLTNFGPRAGLAWDITGDGKTALRAGYGIFYDRLNTLQTNSAADEAPFGTVVDIFGGPTDSMANPYANVAGGNPFPKIGFAAIGTEVLNPGKNAVFVLPMAAFLYARDLRNPYVSSWNLTLERRLPGSWLARASYAGSKGTALASGRDINAPLPNPAATTSTTNQRRPYYPIGLGQAVLMEPAGNSSYNSLQLTAEKRFSRGFTVLANYQFAKTIDDNVGSANKANGTNVTNPYNQHFDRGPADYDLRHVFNFSGVWALPIKPASRLANFAIGGWNMTSIVAWRSGFPFTIASGQDNARTGQGSQRADLTGISPVLANSGHGAIAAQYLNKAAFAVNALGTYGVLGRGTYRGQRSFNLDYGLHKDFPVREKMRFQFRFEAFNLFNNVNLSNPNSTVTSANFMKITSAADPRILQFALRFEF
ncbi:MAG: TonB-dependent receptor [Bryobacterales bacterium]|nr:TonB-dependent receptor [Bryobacterales bacterium]